MPPGKWVLFWPPARIRWFDVFWPPAKLNLGVLCLIRSLNPVCFSISGRTRFQLPGFEWVHEPFPRKSAQFLRRFRGAKQVWDTIQPVAFRGRDIRSRVIICSTRVHPNENVLYQYCSTKFPSHCSYVPSTYSLRMKFLARTLFRRKIRRSDVLYSRKIRRSLRRKIRRSDVLYSRKIRIGCSLAF